MKTLIAGLVVACAVLPAAAANWKLVWSDEFDKPGLPDPAKWTYEEGFLRNNEAQYYTRKRPENARVENGMLIIEARKERFPNAAYDPAAQSNKPNRRTREFAEYTSASLTTQGKASWAHGRIEVRAKLPSGRGSWPAIWTLGTNITQVGWPVCGEIDIMEFVGFEPGIVHANIHANNRERTQKTDKGNQLSVPDASETFHVYAVEWDARRMDIFVDDKKYFTFEKDASGKYAWPYNEGQYLILNLAIGGGWGGAKGIDDGSFPQRYYIDYVRVYRAAD